MQLLFDCVLLLFFITFILSFILDLVNSAAHLHTFAATCTFAYGTNKGLSNLAQSEAYIII